MKTTVATPSRRSPAKVRALRRAAGASRAKNAANTWTPPDFQRRLQEDFGGKIRPFNYVDFLER